MLSVSPILIVVRVYSTLAGLVCFIFLQTLMSATLYAEDLRREVALELDPVANVIGYEIELKSQSKPDDMRSFKLPDTKWSAHLEPGRYTLRLRGIDPRGVAGDWGKPIEVIVPLPVVTLLNPMNKAEIKSGEEVKQEVLFKWQAVSGAKGYELIVQTGSDVVAKEILTSTEYKVDLPVAKRYSWLVRALHANGDLGDLPDKISAFTLYGKKLESPVISVPANEFVRELAWEKVSYADAYSWILKVRKNNKWRTIAKQKDVQVLNVPFSSEYPQGEYSLNVLAKSELRPKSRSAKINFRVAKDRSPAAEERALLETMFKKSRAYSFLASYFITFINYQESWYEENINVSFQDVFAGTGRLGFGYNFVTTDFSVHGIVDMSGMIVGGNNYTYASSEINGQWARRLLTDSQLRFIGGMAYRETVFLRTAGAPATDVIGALTASAVSVHLGTEFLQAISYKLGVLVYGHMYYPVAIAANPLKGTLVPVTSYRLGVMGSLQLKPTITGFMGYAYALDRMEFAEFGNNMQLGGHYLNLRLELDF